MLLPWILAIMILAVAIAGLIYTVKRKVHEHHGDPGTGRR